MSVHYLVTKVKNSISYCMNMFNHSPLTLFPSYFEQYTSMSVQAQPSSVCINFGKNSRELRSNSITTVFLRKRWSEASEQRQAPHLALSRTCAHERASVRCDLWAGKALRRDSRHSVMHRCGTRLMTQLPRLHKHLFAFPCDSHDMCWLNFTWLSERGLPRSERIDPRNAHQTQWYKPPFPCATEMTVRTGNGDGRSSNACFLSDWLVFRYLRGILLIWDGSDMLIGGC